MYNLCKLDKARKKIRLLLQLDKLLFFKASGQVEMPTPLSGGVIPATALPQGAQMTMQARRLYCGNLPFGITEVNYYTVKEILNE